MTAPAVLEDSHESWLEDAVATIIALSHAQPLVSGDDLAREMRRPPHQNLPGIAFSKARTLGFIRPVGYQISTLRSRRHGVQRTWERCSDRRSS